MFSAKLEYQPSDYMSEQKHINPMMRSILVDWLIEVHMKFRLTPETLYLCVNIIDRYCSHAEIDRKKLQLVGVTALLLACKYEEIYPPEVRDCVYITDRAYTRQEVLDMEQDIVKNLKFKLTVPTGYPFLVRFLTITQAPDSIKHTSNYYMERTLQDYAFVEYRQSLVAAAAVSLALNNNDARRMGKVTGPNPGVPKILLEYTGFSKAEILEVANKIVDRVGEEIVTASARELVAVKRKYEDKKYGAVSDFINPDFSDLN
jgi:G2/mitotic-specific cyclin-B, other